MLLKLIYKKDATYFIKLYKPYNIIKYIDSNYTSNSKDQNINNRLLFFYK